MADTAKPAIAITMGDPCGIGPEVVVKALADRLAEAFTELLHRRVRRQWGYGSDENLSSDDLIHEKYR